MDTISDEPEPSENNESFLLNTDNDTETTDVNLKSKTFHISFIITLPVFMGYACCFSLQKHLSVVFGISEGVTGTRLSFIFGIGTSFVYFFNLIFRVLGHNIVFGFFKPRDRVICAFVSLLIGTTMLSILSFSKSPPHVAWVFISYAFVGVCEGSFGPNMLNIVNNFGNTRLWVLLAMPSGVSLITIVGFALISIGVPFQIFYILSAVSTLVSIFIYIPTVYKASKIHEDDSSSFNLRAFWHDLKEFSLWFPKIWLQCVVFIINMFFMGLFNPGCTLYAYQSRVKLNMIGITISHDAFIALYNIGSFLGDFLSRRVMEKKRLIHPLYYFILLVFSAAMNISLIPEIAPLAAFGFMWANGGLYTQTSKYIGIIFESGYHLTATSTWLFLGDTGSTSGSNLVQVIRTPIAHMKSIMF